MAILVSTTIASDMDVQTVYLGHNNPIVITLEGVLHGQKTLGAVDLSNATKITVTIKGVVVEPQESNTPEASVRWSQSKYRRGELRLFLGFEPVPATAIPEKAQITYYDADNPDGLVWGFFWTKVIAKADVDSQWVTDSENEFDDFVNDFTDL